MATTKKKVSERFYIGPDNVKVDKIEEASGARYVLLDPQGAHTFDMQLGEAGKISTMLAVMGFHTKIGNVANSIINDKDAPGTASEAAAAVKDFLDGLEKGTWAERTGGVVRWDNEKLADAFIEWLTNEGKTAPARERVLARLQSEGDADMAWAKSVRNNPPVVTIYKRLVGAVVRTADDLLSGFDS